MVSTVELGGDKTPEECTTAQLVAVHTGQNEGIQMKITGTPGVSQVSTEERAGKPLETGEKGEIRERGAGTDETGLRDETGKDEFKKSRVGNGRKGGEKFMKKEEKGGICPERRNC